MAYAARLQALRVEGNLTDTAAKRAALTTSMQVTTSKTDRTGSSGQSRARRGARTPTADIAATVHEIEAALLTEFEGDEDFSLGTIRHFARSYGTRGVKEARQYKQRIDTWKAWAASREHAHHTYIPISFLREHALRGDVDSYEDIVKAHHVKKMQLRFRARNSRGDAQNSVAFEAWMLNRVAELYPIDAIDAAGNALYDLLDNGLLGFAVAESEEIQDPAIHIAIDGICDPRSRRYVTFTGALAHMTTAERVMLSHRYGLDRLLYGRTFSEEAIDNYCLSVNQGQLTAEELLRAGTDHVQQKGEGNAVPFSTIRQDIIEMILANPPDEADATVHSSAEKVQFTTVLGGEVALLSLSTEDSTILDGVLPADQQAWVEQVIQSAYPPSGRQHGVRAVISALRNGNLMVEKSLPSHFRITLAPSFYGPGVEDWHRAVASRVMGVDRPLYDQDLDVIIRNRLGSTDLATYMQETVIPLLPDWQSLADVLAELNASPAALRVLMSRHVQPEQLWLYNYRLLALKSEAAVALTAGASIGIPPEGWASHARLLKMFRGDSQRLNQEITRMRIATGERLVARDTGGTLDIYYSPASVSLITTVAHTRRQPTTLIRSR